MRTVFHYHCVKQSVLFAQLRIQKGLFLTLPFNTDKYGKLGEGCFCLTNTCSLSIHVGWKTFCTYNTSAYLLWCKSSRLRREANQELRSQVSDSPLMYINTSALSKLVGWGFWVLRCQPELVDPTDATCSLQHAQTPLREWNNLKSTALHFPFYLQFFPFWIISVFFQSISVNEPVSYCRIFPFNSPASKAVPSHAPKPHVFIWDVSESWKQKHFSVWITMGNEIKT